MWVAGMHLCMNRSTVRGAALAQSKLIGALYLATLYVLERSTPKFLSITPPPAEAD